MTQSVQLVGIYIVFAALMSPALTVRGLHKSRRLTDGYLCSMCRVRSGIVALGGIRSSDRVGHRMRAATFFRSNDHDLTATGITAHIMAVLSKHVGTIWRYRRLWITRTNAANVSGLQWCSMPSASRWAASSGTPMARKKASTTSCRDRDALATARPRSVRKMPR